MQQQMLNFAQRVLTDPVTITSAEAIEAPADYVADNTIVWFPKLLIVESGAIEYTCEGQTLKIAAGSLLYRPAWTRSHWLSTGAKRMAVRWCEFDFPTAGLMWREAFSVESDDPRRDVEAMRRIGKLVKGARREQILEAAGELKLMLVRVFAAGAKQHESEGFERSQTFAASFGAVEQAITFLSENFARPDALYKLHQRFDMGENRFRQAFRRRLGISPQHYLLTMRMRAARYYLTDARLALKQVAVKAGYQDPLYFSRMYRKFWGHPPTADRNILVSGAKPAGSFTVQNDSK